MKSDIHVDAELLAAWSEGSLPKDQAAEVEAHLADCSSCQEMLAVFARTEPPPVESGFGRTEPAVFGFSRTRWHWRWAIPIAAAATVAAIWVAIPEEERTAQLRPTDAAPLSDQAPPPAAADAVARALESTQEPKQEPNQELKKEQRKSAENAAPAGKIERFETAAAREAQERDQDLKTDAAQAPASAAAPAAPPRPAQGQLAAPPAAQAQSRLEGDVRSDSLRQVPPEIVSPDPLVRWRVISPPGRLERSSDGGKTWTAIALPEGVTAASAAAPTATTAIVTASDGRQFRTADQGKTWNLVQP